MIGNKGLIGILSTERNNLSPQFVMSLILLKDTMGKDVKVTFAHSGHIPDGRNLILKTAKDLDCDYAIMIDSDMTFPPNGINQLKYTMEKMGADIGCGLYFGTYPPYKSAPMAYDFNGDSHKPITDWSKAREIHSCGMGFTLINKRLFDLKFRFEEGKGEDSLFCTDARAKGYRIILDPMVKLGHLRTIELNEEVVKKLGI